MSDARCSSGAGRIGPYAVQYGRGTRVSTGRWQLGERRSRRKRTRQQIGRCWALHSRGRWPIGPSACGDEGAAVWAGSVQRSPWCKRVRAPEYRRSTAREYSNYAGCLSSCAWLLARGIPGGQSEWAGKWQEARGRARGDEGARGTIPMTPHAVRAAAEARQTRRRHALHVVRRVRPITAAALHRSRG